MPNTTPAQRKYEPPLDGPDSLSSPARWQAEIDRIKALTPDNPAETKAQAQVLAELEAAKAKAPASRYQ